MTLLAFDSRNLLAGLFKIPALFIFHSVAATGKGYKLLEFKKSNAGW